MKIRLLFYIAFALTLVSCESVIDVADKPASSERNTDFNFVVKDKTGSIKKLFGKDVVAGVQVYLRSVSLGKEYTFETDENGCFNTNNLISDQYIVSVKRILSPDEMEILTGTKEDYFRLKNSTEGIINISADNKDSVIIYLDALIKSSPLVISEVYSGGPVGSGLYFHDKYVEVYNQSDSVLYLDGLIIADIAGNPSMGVNYIDDPNYAHISRVWKFPGDGNDYAIQPGEYVVCAEDAIDHRINAPGSVDLSHVRFEFYKDDAPDIDNENVPNMIKIYQKATENDWLIGAIKGAICLIDIDENSLKWYDDHMIVPYENILDGMEYIDDLTDTQFKKLNSVIDASFTGGIESYVGKSMERVFTTEFGRKVLKDDNNSMLDFTITNHPTPGYHF